MTSSQQQHVDNNQRTEIGILTKTLLQSPLVQFIFSARLGPHLAKHVISIGHDFVRVQELDDQGHLHNVVAKRDFGSDIRSANIIGKIDERHEFDVSIKLESHDDAHDTTRPQMIVLCLRSDEVILLRLQNDDRNRPWLKSQSLPLPRFEKVLWQPGQHLAVEPGGRAFVVAAAERNFVLYSLQEPLPSASSSDFPVFTQRIMATEGVITKAEFLQPPGNDPRHIILLLLVVVGSKIKATWLDWYVDNDIYQSQLYPGQALESAVSVPSLLIPLRNATFMVVHGENLMHWKHLTSGSPNVARLDIASIEPLHPGTSPKRPQWVAWSRPERRTVSHQDGEKLYLAREDGVVCLLQIWDDRRIQTCLVTNIDCLIGTVFASVGSLFGADILMTAGEMCTGRLLAIPQHDLSQENNETINISAEDLDLIETLPNWTSVVDLIATNFPNSQKSTRTHDGIFVTSGIQPHGSVAELRRGLAAQLLLLLHIPGLESATGAWVLPLPTTRSFLVLISGTLSTKLFEVGSDYESFSELDALDAPAFDLSCRTLIAALTSQGHAIQITQQGVRFIHDPASISENVAWCCAEDESISVSAINETHSVIALGTRYGEQHKLHMLRVVHHENEDGSSSASLPTPLSMALNAEPLAACISNTPQGHLLAISTADYRVQVFAISSQDDLVLTADISIPMNDEGLRACDAVNFLYISGASDVVLVCGLRDGQILSHVINAIDSPGQLHGEQHITTLGQTAVRQFAWTSNTLCAMSGAATCRLSWDGASAELAVDSIWFVDKLRPELAQEPATACAVIPPIQWLSGDGVNPLADALMLIVGDQLTFAQVLPTVTTVPRQIAVAGTPTRLIYMERQRCLVCASLRAVVRGAAPNACRQLSPILDFIPTRTQASSFTYEMSPGARVYALLEWSITLSEDKVYSYLLVGGSYIRKTGVEGGLVMMLQPTNRRWKVVDINEGPTTKFHEPVYSLCLWNETTYIACSGKSVHLQRFDADLKRWHAVSEPFKLSSPGTHITVVDKLIHISTATDSLVTLQLLEPDNGPAELVTVQLAASAAASLSHTPTSIGRETESLILLSTKYGRLLGMTVAAAEDNTHSPFPRGPPRVAPTAFDVQLPQSLTRIRCAHVRPSWQPPPPAGVLNAANIGACADGTLVGLAVLDAPTWRRLFWLQQLCEWDAANSKSATTNDYDDRDHDYDDDVDDDDDHVRTMNSATAKALPPGLGMPRVEEQALPASSSTATPPTWATHHSSQDRYVNGDILARLWEHGDAESALRDILHHMAEHAATATATARRTGQQYLWCEWVANNLTSELDHVEAVIREVKMILHAWI